MSYFSNSFSITVGIESNPFSISVVENEAAGGWLFLNAWEAEQRKRKARDKRRRELEEETEQIQDALDRQIAQLLREQEAKDDKREDFKRTAELARANADIEAARQYSERVATAYARVIAQGNYSAIEALERELRRAAEEEEFMLQALMVLLD